MHQNYFEIQSKVSNFLLKKILSLWDIMRTPKLELTTTPTKNVFLPEDVEIIEVVDALRNDVSLLKLTVMKNNADGNCLFMAISQALWENQKYFNIVRKQVVNYILSNEQWPKYLPHIKCQHELLVRQEVSDDEWGDIYQAYMSNDRTYGTLQELIAAAALYTFNPIIIRILNEDLFNFQQLNEESENRRTHFFLFTGSADEGHFEWLCPLMDTPALKLLKGNYRTLYTDKGVLRIVKTLDPSSHSLGSLTTSSAKQAITNLNHNHKMTNETNKDDLNANPCSESFKAQSLVNVRRQEILSQMNPIHEFNKSPHNNWNQGTAEHTENEVTKSPDASLKNYAHIKCKASIFHNDNNNNNKFVVKQQNQINRTKNYNSTSIDNNASEKSFQLNSMGKKRNDARKLGEIGIYNRSKYENNSNASLFNRSTKTSESNATTSMTNNNNLSPIAIDSDEYIKRENQNIKVNHSLEYILDRKNQNGNKDSTSNNNRKIHGKKSRSHKTKNSGSRWSLKKKRTFHRLGSEKQSLLSSYSSLSSEDSYSSNKSNENDNEKISSFTTFVQKCVKFCLCCFGGESEDD